MGAKQPKGGPAPPGPASGPRRRLPSRERGDLLAALVARSGEKLARAAGSGGPGPGLPPYRRRVGMIQELLGLVRQGRQEEAAHLLRHLRQHVISLWNSLPKEVMMASGLDAFKRRLDKFLEEKSMGYKPCKDLGMESTSLDDVLYRYASFRNLVDPITHDLLISLARYIHCPRPEGDSLGAMEKLCRQLTYHLSPHTQWRRQGIVKRKPQACLKAILVGNPQDNTMDLSGIPLSLKELDRVTSYLQLRSEHIEIVELRFTELTDEMFLQLLPVLSTLPHLTTLSLNGNRLTRAILRDLTEALKDTKNFPSMSWIDLGNNVDIFSLPQPFLVSLKKRCPKQGNLPTILEFGEGQASDLESQEGLCTADKDWTESRQYQMGEATGTGLPPRAPTTIPAMVVAATATPGAPLT